MKSIKCLLGRHNWSASSGGRRKCLRCNRENRCDRHEWVACVCAKCNQRKSVVAAGHLWTGCVCSKCNQQKPIGAGGHSWSGCLCIQCHQTKPSDDPEHVYVNCVCTRCQLKDPAHHEWEEIERWDNDHGQMGTCSLYVRYRCRHCGEEEVKKDETATLAQSWENIRGESSDARVK